VTLRCRASLMLRRKTCYPSSLQNRKSSPPLPRAAT
jgi:hypothetical protein